MLVELVNHVWSGPHSQYARMLGYQLNALIDHPTTRVSVDLVVCYSPGDGAAACMLDGIEDHINSPLLKVTPWPMTKERLFQRAIGRNERALATKADVWWAIDTDYLPLAGCLDALEQLVDDKPLYFPRRTWICKDHATGDKYVNAIPLLRHIDPADFIPKTEHKSIGGLQIVPGDVAREHGYCPNSKWQRPAPPGTDTIIGFQADRAYRASLGTSGTPIDLPNLYRLRHTITGDGRKASGVTAP